MTRARMVASVSIPQMYSGKSTHRSTEPHGGDPAFPSRHKPDLPSQNETKMAVPGPERGDRRPTPFLYDKP